MSIKKTQKIILNLRPFFACIFAIFLLPCLFAFSFFATFSKNKAFAEQSVSYFAKIQAEGVYFFQQPFDEDAQRLFCLPRSYFVKILSEENETFYRAQYDDVYGYVRKSDVVVMDGTPTTPYASARFRVFSLNGLGLYSSPQFIEGNLRAQIPYLTENIVYYGPISGEQTIPDKTNVWYYCRVTDTSQRGYVYSVFCDKLTEIPVNTQSFAIVSDPNFGSATPVHSLSPVAMAFIVIGVSLPCLIVIFLLLKPSLQKQPSLSSGKKQKSGKRSDYYEFDESDLN